MRTVSSSWIAVSALLAAMVSIQFGASVAKELFRTLGVLEVTLVRLGIAAVIMAVVLRSWRARINASNWQWLLIYGGSLAGMNIMFFLAIQILPLGIAAAIQFLGPLSVAIFTSRRCIDLFWSATAAIGLVLITEFIGSVGRIDFVGLSWALGAAFCWALYIVSGQRAGAEHGLQTAALGMALAALISVPFGAADITPDAYSKAVLLMLVAVATLSGVIPFTLEMVALRALPTRIFGTLMSLEPVVAALVGWARLGENLTATQTVAVLLIVVASAGATLSARQPTKDGFAP